MSRPQTTPLATGLTTPLTTPLTSAQAAETPRVDRASRSLYATLTAPLHTELRAPLHNRVDRDA